jgi:hypothetical protein
MMRVSNPVMRVLLRSPAGGPMRRQFMVLRFFGRKTGRRYDIPVVAHRLDGELYALTDAAWRNNFCGGADVEVTLDGHVTRMRGQLLEDPQAVAPLYARAIGHFGVKRAQRMLGLKIPTPGTPAAEELAEAARRYHLTAIRLTHRRVSRRSAPRAEVSRWCGTRPGGRGTYAAQPGLLPSSMTGPRSWGPVPARGMRGRRRAP